MTMKLVSATNFNLEQLADIYNGTRVDYIIPMPMTATRLGEYIQFYDIDLSCSYVALDEADQPLGLGMLGVRQQRSWITRLGVLPAGRRHGTGRELMVAMLQASQERQLPNIWLEVIKNNLPAHQLFLNLQFTQTRELIVARRPPRFNLSLNGEKAGLAVDHVRTYNAQDAHDLFEQRSGRANWLNETQSLTNINDLSALAIRTAEGGYGWVACRPSLLRLTNIVVEVIAGDPAGVTAAALNTLHELYSTQDAIAENIPVDDPKWPGFVEAGYFDSFHRIEMVRKE